MWDSEIPLLLRYVIGDVAATPKYSDDRLIQLALVAAQLTQTEVDFSQDYAVSIENETLAPDPTVSPRDDAFINLTVLRGACLLARAGLVAGSTQAISIQDGSSRIDLTKNLEGTRLLITSFCEAYEQAKWQYITRNGVAGEAIIGPYRTALNAAYGGGWMGGGCGPGNGIINSEPITPRVYRPGYGLYF
jgi:hypothetical protein